MKKFTTVFTILFFVSSVALADDDVMATINDPIESVNRGIFSFNDTLDVHVMEPIAKGYDSITPDRVQIGVRNFFRNLFFPSYLLSDVVQFNFSDAATHSGRFVINTILGLVGTIDVAKEFGLEHKETDFGIALAHYDIPPGPYLVIPFLGPSNLRDAVGRLVDTAVDPLTFVAYSNAPWEVKTGAIGLRALYYVNLRASLLDPIKSAKESSLDYYLFTQSAYYQYRDGLLKGRPVEKYEKH
jgi:phospholipid-binding lipoprotein MlaA